MSGDASPEPGAEAPWPGPDRYTLRGMVELELALGTDVTVDAAHTVLSDGVARAFGPRWYDWLTEALSAEGRDPEDLRVLLTDDALTDRVLALMHARMGEDDEAPEPPHSTYGWYAYAPDDPGGSRAAWRRAVRERRRRVRTALLTPRRPPVAGRRNER